jgi:hypothetical protein
MEVHLYYVVQLVIGFYRPQLRRKKTIPACRRKYTSASFILRETSIAYEIVTAVHCRGSQATVGKKREKGESRRSHRYSDNAPRFCVVYEFPVRLWWIFLRSRCVSATRELCYARISYARFRDSLDLIAAKI